MAMNTFTSKDFQHSVRGLLVLQLCIIGSQLFRGKKSICDGCQY